MSSLAEEKDHYLAQFVGLERTHSRKEADWLKSLRKRAFAHFVQKGFPTTRDEDWKYTNLAAMAQIPFAPAGKKTPEIHPQDLYSASLAQKGCIELVYINGRFNKALSSVIMLPEQIRVMSLAEMIKEYPKEAEKHLSPTASYEGNAFGALNTSFLEDGAFIHLPEGEVLDRPVHLLFVSTDTEPLVTHPRNVVILENRARLVLVETHITMGSSSVFTNTLMQASIGERAEFRHCKLQCEGSRAFHIATAHFHQREGSVLASHSISLGGHMIRNNVRATLDGTGSECTLNGLYITADGQHVDNHTQIEHKKPECISHELYKGVLDGKSTGVFYGKIHVWEDAQKTDAKQTNKNLLLSEDATINTRPQLEIYADDVKCTHGATVGQLDEDALFYLRSRGIDESGARHLLIHAFAGDILDRIQIDSIKDHLKSLVEQRLGEGGRPPPLYVKSAAP